MAYLNATDLQAGKKCKRPTFAAVHADTNTKSGLDYHAGQLFTVLFTIDGSDYSHN